MKKTPPDSSAESTVPRDPPKPEPLEASLRIRNLQIRVLKKMLEHIPADPAGGPVAGTKEEK